MSPSQAAQMTTQAECGERRRATPPATCRVDSPPRAQTHRIAVRTPLRDSCAPDGATERQAAPAARRHRRSQQHAISTSGRREFSVVAPHPIPHYATQVTPVRTLTFGAVIPSTSACIAPHVWSFHTVQPAGGTASGPGTAAGCVNSRASRSTRLPSSSFSVAVFCSSCHSRHAKRRHHQQRPLCSRHEGTCQPLRT